MKKEPSSNKRAIAVGVFILIGLLFLVGGVLSVGNLHSTFQKKMTISTVFSDVNGLQEGNNIWFSGVKIGTVKKLQLIDEHKVLVIMNINLESQQFIRKDAMVKLSSDGLIGNRILVIYGGSQEAGAVKEGDRLKNEMALSTEEMMVTLQKNNINILALTERLANGEGTLGRLLTSDDIYNNLAATSAALQSATANAQVFIASLNNYAANLNKEGTLANDLVTDTTVFNSLQASMKQLEQMAGNAEAAVKNLKEAAENPNSPMGVLMRDEKAGADIKRTIANLEASSVALNKNLEALQYSFLFRKAFKKQEKAKEKADTIN
jgi:phospholipid/cholesterol/gamma-HCH transport system substrate-binding protein